MTHKEFRALIDKAANNECSAAELRNLCLGYTELYSEFAVTQDAVERYATKEAVLALCEKHQLDPSNTTDRSRLEHLIRCDVQDDIGFLAATWLLVDAGGSSGDLVDNIVYRHQESMIDKIVSTASEQLDS